MTLLDSIMWHSAETELEQNVAYLLLPFVHSFIATNNFPTWDDNRYRSARGILWGVLT